MIDNDKSLVSYDEDEIDLYELWLILKRRSKLIFIITVITILSVIAYIIFTPNIYKTNFIIQAKCDTISSYQLKESINNLENLIKDKEYFILAKKLKSSDIEAIKKIDASIPRDEKRFVLVTLEITTPKEIDIFINKLLNYLNSIPSIKREIIRQRQLLKSFISILQEETKKLQHLQKKLNNNSTFINSLSIQIDPLQIALSIQKNKEEIVQLQTKLKELQAARLAVEAVTPKKPYWPNIGLLLSVGFVSGLFLSVFLAFFVEYLENAKRRFNQEDKTS